jgi:hypothetical protein
LDRENKIAGLIPRLVFNDKSTYVKSSTKVYDDVSPASAAISEQREKLLKFVLFSFFLEKL